MSQEPGVGSSEPVKGEARWPMAAAVVTAMVLTALRPAEVRIAPAWVLPGIEAVLLIAITIGDPGRIDRRNAVLRALSISIVAILALDTLASTALLIDVLIHGGKATNSAEQLLAAGAGV